MKKIEYQIVGLDEDGVVVCFTLAQTGRQRIDVAVQNPGGFDGTQLAALFLVVVHSALLSPGGSEAMAGDVEQLLMQCDSLLKVREMREKHERPSRKWKGVGDSGVSDDNDSEIPF